MNKYEKLIEKTIEARSFAYAPYSNFKVGACALLKNGEYITGCNVENISYGLSNCAERTCLFKLVSEGYNPHDVELFCIVGSTSDPISPCGACRQVMSELLLPKTKVVLANLKGNYKEYTVEELIPYTFKEIEHAE